MQRGRELPRPDMPDALEILSGLKSGDVILEVGGKKISKDYPLSAAIAHYSVGQTLSLKVLRAGKELTVSVTLAKRPST